MLQPKTANLVVLRDYKLKRDSLLVKHIKLDFTASPHPLATCLICKRSIEIRNTDNFEFIVVSVYDKKGNLDRSKTLKTNTAVMKWFQDQHWESCIHNRLT